MKEHLEYPQPLVELYDAMHPGPLKWGDDRELYRTLAEELGNPVLELGVGTARVARFVAERGIKVVGLDVSIRMLNRARVHLDGFSAETRRNVELKRGDMRDFDLGMQSPLAIIPFTAFQHLLTVEDQRGALECIRRHLVGGGHLVVDLFDPKLEWCAPHPAAARRIEYDGPHPVTGRHWKIVSDVLENIPEEQILHRHWRFVELGDDGRALGEYHWRLTLRWSYRFEMQHLLERSGYDIVALWGDYQRGPFKYGQRQVWLVRKG